MSDVETQSFELIPSSSTGAIELIGRTLGEYTIETLIARGGYAQVFRGVSNVDGQSVAIKVLHPELSSTGTAVARFLREAQVLARLDHPNIVKILSAGEMTMSPYIVMEWLAGHTLADELDQRGRFSLDELLGIMEELCSALATAHAAGVVHRDIKPSNIVVVPDGDWFQLKLVDFGIARLVDGELVGETGRLGLTVTGTVIGTPTYMAPEQLLGQKVDEKSDIYSLGLIAFLLLVGRPPFVADGHTEISEQHLFVPAPRVSSFVPVPPAVDAVIARCLAKRPADRITSVHALAEELRKAIRPAARASDPKGAPPEYVGIHVGVVFDGPDEELNDSVLEEIDALLMRAEQWFTGTNIEVFPAAGAAILARQMVAGGSAGRTMLEAALHRALDMADALLPELTSAKISYSIAVHVVTDPDELFDPRWTVNNPRSMVVATTAALEGLTDSFEVTDLDDSTLVRQIARMRR